MSFVVGTAGHIDHGKSTLVEALTGVNPDRLAEEIRRGMTIDLGFAHLTLPSGRDVGIVDVPGHARFIRNMLAGAHGIDAVMLVVAADDGVMPQTREHLDILDLLGVGRGVVVLTKSDLVDPEWLQLVESEVTATLEGTSLQGASVVSVSALRREGLDALVMAVDRLLAETPARPENGRPRLPVDRVFTMSGFGTVVTGTLSGGSISVGDELELVPARRRVRVRGLQRHNQPVDTAWPGNRVAANLGGVEKSDTERGDVLAAPGSIAPTRRVDARIKVVGSAMQPLRHGSELMLHTGTAEVACRVIVLEADDVAPGGEAWVQLYLERPVAVEAADRFVLRMPSPAITLAGGSFTDIAPTKHRRHDAAVATSLARRAAGGVLQEELARYPRGVRLAALVKATQADPAEADQLSGRRLGEWIFSETAWQAIAGRAAAELAAYHTGHPLRAGMVREELRTRIGVPPSAGPAVIGGLVEDGVLVDSSGLVSLSGHRPEEAVNGAAGDLIRLLDREPFAPPSLKDAMAQTAASAEVVKSLVQRGEIVRLSDEVVFTKPAYERAVAMVREIVADQGSVTVAGLRDRMQASRRPVLALLEHLDAERITRRVGDSRVLR